MMNSAHCPSSCLGIAAVSKKAKQRAKCWVVSVKKTSSARVALFEDPSRQAKFFVVWAGRGEAIAAATFFETRSKFEGLDCLECNAKQSKQ